jgi:ABC-2 type transport system permease protein
VIAQLRSELLKQRTTRMTLTLLAWMLGLILVVVLLHVFGLSAARLRIARNQPDVFGWGTSIGALFAALSGAISITGEIRNGTIRPTLLANPERAVVIAAKLLATALAGVLIGLIAEALVIGIASAGLAIRGIHIALGAGDFAQMLAGGAGAAALWAAIGTGLGAIVRNQVGAVVGLCVWLLVIESLLLGDVPSAGRFAPGASAGAIAGMIQNAGNARLLAPALGAVLLAGYAAAAAALGVVATERRDVD